MDRNLVVLFIAINVVVVAFGGILSYADVYMKNYTGTSHENTEITDVEYGLLVYRVTYQYYDVKQKETAVTVASWTLDCLQLSILVVAVVDLLWVLFEKQKKPKTGFQSENSPVQPNSGDLVFEKNVDQFYDNS